MKNEKETKTTATAPKSNTPLLIMGAVLMAAGLFAWYMLSSSSKPATTATANNSTANKPPASPKATMAPNAPAGAQPPNQSGSPNAMVTLEEFADFQCGSCAAAHPILNEIKSTYGSKIRFIFRNFPLEIPAHDKSYEAALAAEAAGLQSKFWDMQNIIFTNQKGWSTSKDYKEIWRGYAESIGLDVAKWEKDMKGIVATARVQADIDRGKALGITGTPTLYINGVSVEAPELRLSVLKPLIDAELQRVAPQASPASNAPAESGNQNK